LGFGGYERRAMGQRKGKGVRVRLVRRADGGAYEDGGEPDVQVDGGIGQGIR
jgi:hypothetical protein